MNKIAKSLHYDIRFLGSDYLGKEWDGKAYELAAPCFIERRHDFSTTELVKRIQDDARPER